MQEFVYMRKDNQSNNSSRFHQRCHLCICNSANSNQEIKETINPNQRIENVAIIISLYQNEHCQVPKLKSKS